MSIATELADEVVRYCPECGLIGPVGEGHQTCCPDSFGMSVRRWQAEKMDRMLNRLRDEIVRLLRLDRVNAELVEGLRDLEAMAERYRRPGAPIRDAQKKARAALTSAT